MALSIQGIALGLNIQVQYVQGLAQQATGLPSLAVPTPSLIQLAKDLTDLETGLRGLMAGEAVVQRCLDSIKAADERMEAQRKKSEEQMSQNPLKPPSPQGGP